MNKKLQFQGALLLAGMAVAALTPMAARSAPPVPSGVTVTVTAVGKKDAPPRAVKKDDVQLYQGKERKQVANWRRGETLFIAVLIDDSLRSSIANQWNDLRAFLMAQPPTTYIAVAYARNGTAMVAQDFTTDHALVFAEAPVSRILTWIRPLSAPRKKTSMSGQSMPAMPGVVDAVRSALSMPNPT